MTYRTKREVKRTVVDYVDVVIARPGDAIDDSIAFERDNLVNHRIHVTMNADHKTTHMLMDDREVAMLGRDLLDYAGAPDRIRTVATDDDTLDRVVDWAYHLMKRLNMIGGKSGFGKGPVGVEEVYRGELNQLYNLVSHRFPKEDGDVE